MGTSPPFHTCSWCSIFLLLNINHIARGEQKIKLVKKKKKEDKLIEKLKK
jgi:hypothetical protein